MLDACVLVPIALADTLLRVAEHELYRPLWSDRIIQEATGAILKIHPEITPALVHRRFMVMNNAFEEAQVEDWEPLENAITLPDPNDCHVVATAIRAGADAIVTSNLRDYPADSLELFGIEAIHPDDFLLDQLDLAPRIILEVLTEQAAHTRNPPLTPVDLIARLSKAGVSRFADEVSRLI